MNATLSLPMPRHGATPAGPPWPTLAWLAAAVLLAHTLVLQTTPSRIGPALDPDKQPMKAFVTRRIVQPPVEAAAPAIAPPPPARPRVAPRKKPPVVAPETVASEAPAASGVESTSVPPAEGVAEPMADAGATAARAAASTPVPPVVSAAPAGPAQTPVTAMNLPPSVQLAYAMTGQAKGLTYHANATLAWSTSGSQYDVRMTVSALFLGSRSMASTGQVSAEGLAPTRFFDKSRTEVAAHFEPDKGQITFSANTPSAPWAKGAQDRVSVFMQLGGMLAGNPAAFPAGSTISLYTVGPREAETWTFAVEPAETLQLPFGELQTVRLSRQPRREFDQKVEIWYAPSLGYLPVRNRITQPNGDFIDQQLDGLKRP